MMPQSFVVEPVEFDCSASHCQECQSSNPVKHAVRLNITTGTMTSRVPEEIF